MMTTVLITVAVLAAIFFIEMIAVSNAPVGYEDENGFHFAPDAKNPTAEAPDMGESLGCLNPT
jgi:hypothetical protein